MAAIGGVIVLVGALAIFVGSIMVIIKAFQESLLWGIGSLLIIPFVLLIFVVLNWTAAKKGFLVLLGGTVVMILGAILVFAYLPFITVETKKIVESATGTDRLVYKDIGGAGFYVDALIELNPPRIEWQRSEGGSWVDYITITVYDFQPDPDSKGGNHPHWRSFYEIHSFDPTKGTAVLLISEGEETSDGISETFSWREWDLHTNKEVRTIRVCDGFIDAMMRGLGEHE